MAIHQTNQRNTGRIGYPRQKYLLQENPWAAQGRGYQLQVVTKPQVPQAKPHTWRKGRPAFWEQLRAIFHLALQQPEQWTCARLHAAHPPCP